MRADQLAQTVSAVEIITFFFLNWPTHVVGALKFLKLQIIVEGVTGFTVLCNISLGHLIYVDTNVMVNYN